MAVVLLVDLFKPEGHSMNNTGGMVPHKCLILQGLRAVLLLSCIFGASLFEVKFFGVEDLVDELPSLVLALVELSKRGICAVLER